MTSERAVLEGECVWGSGGQFVMGERRVIAWGSRFEGKGLSLDQGWQKLAQEPPCLLPNTGGHH